MLTMENLEKLEKITLNMWGSECEFELSFDSYCETPEEIMILKDVWQNFIKLPNFEELINSTKQNVEDFCLEIINGCGPDKDDPEYAVWIDGIVDGKINNIFDCIEPMYVMVSGYKSSPEIGIAFNTWPRLGDKNLVIVFCNNQFKEVQDEPSFL